MELFEESSSPTPRSSAAELTSGHSERTSPAASRSKEALKGTSTIHDKTDTPSDSRQKRARPRANYQRFAKPPYSYIGMIALVILKAPFGMLRLREVDQELEKTFPAFFTTEYKGWKGSVRRSLYYHACFVKSPTDPSGAGGSHYWRVNIHQLPNNAFKLQVNTPLAKTGTWSSDLRTQLGVGLPPVTHAFDARNQTNQCNTSAPPRCSLPDSLNLHLPLNIESLLSPIHPPRLHHSPVGASSPIFRPCISPGPDMRRDFVHDVNSPFSSLNSSPGRQISTNQASLALDLTSHDRSSSSVSIDSIEGPADTVQMPDPTNSHATPYQGIHSSSANSTGCSCRKCQLRHQSIALSSPLRGLYPAFHTSVIPWSPSHSSGVCGCCPPSAHDHRLTLPHPYSRIAAPIPRNVICTHAREMIAKTERLQQIKTQTRPYDDHSSHVSNRAPGKRQPETRPSSSAHLQECHDFLSHTQTTLCTTDPLTSTRSKTNASPPRNVQNDSFEEFLLNQCF